MGQMYSEGAVAGFSREGGQQRQRKRTQSRPKSRTHDADQGLLIRSVDQGLLIRSVDQGLLIRSVDTGVRS
jgi:hypothetical protein